MSNSSIDVLHGIVVHQKQIAQGLKSGYAQHDFFEAYMQLDEQERHLMFAAMANELVLLSTRNRRRK